MSTLLRLQDWFAQHCNGEREHQFGITIESCDNPGWWVKIDLTATPLEQQTFTPIYENVDERGFQKGPCWLACYVQDRVWNGAGDETKLERILNTFLNWAGQSERS